MTTTGERNSGFVRAALIVGTVLLCVSAAVNMVAIWRVRALRASSVASGIDIDLQPGRTLAPLVASDLEGRRVTLRYNSVSVPTVLYVFTPQCGWCERNLSNLRTVIARRGERYRIVGLSLADHGLDDFVASSRLGIPIYKDPTPETSTAYDLGGTPVTLIVAPTGRILAHWRGAWVGPVSSAAQSLFGLRFPGLSAPPPTTDGGQGE